MNPNPMIVVHGGAGNDKIAEDGCAEAARAGARTLAMGGDAFAAASAAVVILEDDPRFNAGTGSVLGLDGETIEMDAAIMACDGRIGAVACLQHVKNPILVAQAVAATPHYLLCGEGAQWLARQLGHGPYYAPTRQAIEAHAAMLHQLESANQAFPGVDNGAFAQHWNYRSGVPFRAGKACDTVGAVARDSDARFAVAGSTGGSAPSLLGRVGDTPIVGSGFYAGALGAIAATGVGEYIIKHMLARTVYQWIADGMPLQAALERGIGLFEPDVDIGLIGVTATESGNSSNRAMPWFQLHAATAGA